VEITSIRMNPREKAIVELVRQDWKDAGRSM
jgi:hypothetical protein